MWAEIRTKLKLNKKRNEWKLRLQSKLPCPPYHDSLIDFTVIRMREQNAWLNKLMVCSVAYCIGLECVTWFILHQIVHAFHNECCVIKCLFSYAMFHFESMYVFYVASMYVLYVASMYIVSMSLWYINNWLLFCHLYPWHFSLQLLIKDVGYYSSQYFCGANSTETTQTGYFRSHDMLSAFLAITIGG
jgi:hypothetical protein